MIPSSFALINKNKPGFDIMMDDSFMTTKRHENDNIWMMFSFLSS